MSKPTEAAGGGTQPVIAGSGEPEKTIPTEPVVPEQPQTVSYESYAKLLDQHKKSQLRLKQVEGKLTEKEGEELKEYEQRLMKSGEVQKLIQIKDEKIETLSKKAMELEQGFNNLQETLKTAAKTQAVLTRLPGQLVNSEYMAFIDTSKVVLNPDTNEIDNDSVDVVVGEFVKKHPHLIKAETRTLPNGSPRPAQKLSYNEWLKLPVKEKRTRLKDVDGFVPSTKR